MFRSAITLPFKILGIPIKLDMSFLLVLPLFAFLIGSQIPTYVQLFARGVDATAIQTGATPYILGLIAAIGLFSSVLIHELGHAVTARYYKVETKEITLWFLGGLARFDEIPKQRGAEAVTAIAGPITSMLLAGIFFLLYRSVSGSTAILFIFGYLATTNFALAIFNLLPALPLDGGRVLRSLLALRLPYVRATQISGNISRILAILLGIYGLFTGQIFLLAVAFFIYNAVNAETKHAVISEGLDHLFVADLMTKDVSTVYPDMPLSQFERMIYYRHFTGYPVVSNDNKVVGFAKLQDVNQFRNEDGVITEQKTISDIMTEVESIPSTESATNALKRLANSPVGRFVVINEAGQMEGLVSKTDLMNVITKAATAK